MTDTPEYLAYKTFADSKTAAEIAAMSQAEQDAYLAEYERLENAHIAALPIWRQVAIVLVPFTLLGVLLAIVCFIFGLPGAA